MAFFMNMWKTTGCFRMKGPIELKGVNLHNNTNNFNYRANTEISKKKLLFHTIIVSQDFDLTIEQLNLFRRFRVGRIMKVARIGTQMNPFVVRTNARSCTKLYCLTKD